MIPETRFCGQCEEAPAAAGSSVAAATPQLQGQQNHPSLLPSSGADTAVGTAAKLEPTIQVAIVGFCFVSQGGWEYPALHGHFLTALLQRIWIANL